MANGASGAEAFREQVSGQNRTESVGEMVVGQSVLRVEVINGKEYEMRPELTEIRALTDKCSACWKEFIYWLAVVFTVGLYYVFDRREKVVEGTDASSGQSDSLNNVNRPPLRQADRSDEITSPGTSSSSSEDGSPASSTGSLVIYDDGDEDGSGSTSSASTVSSPGGEADNNADTDGATGRDLTVVQVLSPRGLHDVDAATTDPMSRAGSGLSEEQHVEVTLAGDESPLPQRTGERARRRPPALGPPTLRRVATASGLGVALPGTPTADEMADSLINNALAVGSAATYQQQLYKVVQEGSAGSDPAETKRQVEELTVKLKAARQQEEKASGAAAGSVSPLAKTMTAAEAALQAARDVRKKSHDKLHPNRVNRGVSVNISPPALGDTLVQDGAAQLPPGTPSTPVGNGVVSEGSDAGKLVKQVLDAPKVAIGKTLSARDLANLRNGVQLNVLGGGANPASEDARNVRSQSSFGTQLKNKAEALAESRKIKAALKKQKEQEAKEPHEAERARLKQLSAAPVAAAAGAQVDGEDADEDSSSEGVPNLMRLETHNDHDGDASQEGGSSPGSLSSQAGSGRSTPSSVSTEEDLGEEL